MPLTSHEKAAGERWLVVGYRKLGDVLVFGGFKSLGEAREYIEMLTRGGITGYSSIQVEEAGESP